MLRIILIMILLMRFCMGNAQNFDQTFKIKTYSVNEGLSQFSSNRVIQDRYGFMWVITWDGLNRFDGNGFVSYRHNPFNATSLSGNRVLEILIDRHGELWVIIENGTIDKYDYQKDQFDHYSFHPLKHAIVTAFCQDRDDNFWIGTTNGLYKASLNGKCFDVDTVFLKSSVPDKGIHISGVVNGDNRDMMVGTTSGVYVLSYKSNNLYQQTKVLDHIAVNTIYKDDYSTIWIGSDQGLFYTNANESGKQCDLKDVSISSLGKFNIRDIRAITSIDKDNCIIFPLKNVYVLNLQDKSVKPLKLSDYSFFDNNLVQSVYVDKTKNIWIASLLKGIAKIDIYQTKDIVLSKQGTEGMFIKSVFKDSRGRVWIGTNFEGLHYYDHGEPIKSISVYGREPAFMLASPSISEDKNGNIWFSFNSMLYCYSYESDEIVPMEYVYPNNIKLTKPFSTVLDAYGTMWVGCADGLVRLRFNNNKISAETIPIGNLSDMISSEQIGRLLYDPIHNAVWACTKNDGVSAIFLNKDGNVLDIKNLIHSDKATSLSCDHVWSVAVSADSTVWLGTDSGLNRCRITSGSIVVEPVTNLKKINNLKVMSLTDDGKNNLWIGTSQGLFSFNYKTGVERKFTIENGLYANAVLEGMFIDSCSMYVGTIAGLNIIDTDLRPDNQLRSNVILTDFRVFGNSVKSDPKLVHKLRGTLFETPKIVLKYDENNFTIDFMSLQYNDLDNKTFIYKLEGFDRDSIIVDSKSGSVTYNRVPAGRYRFWVKSSSNENDSGGEMCYITIVVRPAPWVSFWAICIYILLVAGVLSLVYYYLNKEARLKQQLQINEIENKRQEEISSMQLRFHSNIAHDIRTPITLIAAPLEDIINEKAIIENSFVRDRIGIINKNVERLLSLVNQFLDYNEGNKLNLEVHDVAKVIGQTVELFYGVALSRKINYEYVIDVNNSVLIFDSDKISKILINLISNAFKCTPIKGDVYVFVEQHNEKLFIKVLDTGSGISKEDQPKIFERFYQSKRSTSGSGIGLALVKQLVELCGGTIEVKSIIGEGSQFLVTIPCQIVEPESDIEQPVDETDSKNNLLYDADGSNKKSVILIVDDDKELRGYLAKSFRDNHTVVTAKDGQAGFDMALRYTPDLILTDIIMPNMNGVSFIKLIRNDYRTSHIPIVVLASKSEGEEIRSLEAGADDFIYKPFSTKILKLKVTNFIRQQSNKKEHKQPIDTDVKELVNMEQQFLTQMNSIILENLENPMFSIEFICDRMSISRMQLHRKIVALLGKSTSEYIREIKLDQAKKYFEGGQTDIESVMLRIGFTSSFHFNKNFKNRYGVSVREFIDTLPTQ